MNRVFELWGVDEDANKSPWAHRLGGKELHLVLEEGVGLWLREFAPVVVPGPIEYFLVGYKELADLCCVSERASSREGALTAALRTLSASFSVLHW